MTDIILKKADPEDVPAIVAVERKMAGSGTCYAITAEEEWKKEMGNSVVYVIIKDGKIIGDAAFEVKSKDHIYGSGLMIDPEYQNQGIGREVLTRFVKELKGVKRIDMTVHPHNSAAIGLYLRFGFVIESWKDNYYGDGQPRIIMAKCQ